MNQFINKCLLVSTIVVLPLLSNGQTNKALAGAWQSDQGNEHAVVLIQDGYLTYTAFTDRSFLFSLGGPFKDNAGILDLKVEFDSRSSQDDSNPLLNLKVPFSVNDGVLRADIQGSTVAFKQIDHSDAPLAGVWQITDRLENDKLIPIQRSGTRKTLKMLTGTRFQWFAIDPATRLFAGTGGGTYTFKDGKYTENILFFSRDNSRVGASLVFDGRLEDGKWHHSGLSSTGNEIYEVWGKSQN